MFGRYAKIPPSIRAAMSPEQRQYFETTYRKARFGPEYITAHRRLEMLVADTERRDFFLGYWPDEAMHLLQEFKRNHFDHAPTKGEASPSPLNDRLRIYYPRLFPMLDMRMQALQDAIDTHPALKPLWYEYVDIREMYYRKLVAAEELTSHIPASKKRNKMRHDFYREAFAAVYPRLKDLLDELIVMSR